MAVALVYDDIFLKHDTGAHVENRERLVATMDLLNRSGLLTRLSMLTPREATREELALVHSEHHIRRVESTAGGHGVWLDGDTFASPVSYEVALYAAGGALRAIDAVASGEVSSAFALVRPPGHHATSDAAMGFCLFNNIAIAAQYARRNHKLGRILIADFDVHHGNGTEDSFERDPDVLYFSTHQYPHYPGTGYISDDGIGEGKGATVNVPLPAFCGDAEYHRAYEELLVPVARRFKPDMILVSAGYDLHWADQLSGMQVTVDGFADIVGIIKGLADELCDGKLFLTLEGGYNLKALSASIAATLEVMLGGPLSPDPIGKPGGERRPMDADSVIDLVASKHGLK